MQALQQPLERHASLTFRNLTKSKGRKVLWRRYQCQQACEQQMLLEEAGKYDVDMFLLPVSLEAAASISSFWVSTHTPPLKLFSERPVLQLFHHPLAMFLELPGNCEVQNFQAKLSQLLYDSGVEVVFPT